MTGAHAAIPVFGPRTGAPGRNALLDRLSRRVQQVESVYFAGDRPLVYFARSQNNVSAHSLRQVQKGVWNEGSAPVLLVPSGRTLHLIDAWRPPDDSQALEDLVLDQFDVDDVNSLSKIHRESFESGDFFHRYKKAFAHAGRCETSLLENLRATAQALLDSGLSKHVVHRLLLRSILVLHLEHRHFLPHQLRFPDILNDYHATLQLFLRLQLTFNGDLLPVESSELAELEPEHFRLLARFLKGEERLARGQLTLWPAYDFAAIPIETVSAIYEDLIHTLGRTSVGVHYTPPEVVDFMLDEVLPASVASTATVADFSCGSGAFLVGAARRLAGADTGDSEANALSQLQSVISEGRIFGVDRDPSAVHVAAFSLGLLCLDQIESEADLKWFTFPRFVRSEENPDGCLAVGDAFEVEDGREFDVIVGNPPWRRSALTKPMEDWCELHDCPKAKQLAYPFMWLSFSRLREGGRFALVTPASWLHNQEGPDREFRKEYLERAGVRAVLNLTRLRTGSAQIFAHAIAPAAIVIGGDVPRNELLYVAPKPSTREGHLPFSTVLEGADVKWIPAETRKRIPHVWKTLSVGDWADVALSDRLLSGGKTLQAIILERGWSFHRGFQPGGDLFVDFLNEALFLPTSRATHLTSEVRDLSPFASRGFKWTGPLEIYRAPHVVIKRAPLAGRVAASFIDVDLTFRDSLMGLAGPKSDEALLKAITVFLSSSLVAYLLLMTSSSWAVERPRLTKREIKKLPAGIVLSNPGNVELLAQLYDSALENLDWEVLDAAVYHIAGVSESERNLIERGMQNERGGPAALRELGTYARAVLDCWKRLRPRDDREFAYDVIKYSGIAAVAMSYGDTKAAAEASLRQLLEIRDLQIEDRLLRQRYSREINSNGLLIVKPDDRREWTPASAFSDFGLLFEKAAMAPQLYGG